MRYQCNQEGVAATFPTEAARLTIEADLTMINALTQQITRLEKKLVEMARFDDPGTFFRLRAVPGIGDILALVILYEIGELGRFRTAGQFLSYARLVPGQHTSAGKNYGSPGKRQGNPHLKWAFSEAAVLFLRANPEGQKLHSRLVKKHGKAKALGILSARLARSVYFMLHRNTPFDMDRFVRA